MCKLKGHTCRCGVEYDCTYPNYVCPTLNEDEDMNLCDACMEKESTRQQAAWEEYMENEEFDIDDLGDDE